jgi:hypothetical protein
VTTITAQQTLDENNYTISDISLVRLEYLIDNAIDYVNLETGSSMSNMSGTPTKTVSVTSAQAAVVKSLIVLLLKAYLDRGPNIAVGGLTVTSLLGDPQFVLFKDMVDKGMNQLRGRSFVSTR